MIITTAGRETETLIYKSEFTDDFKSEVYLRSGYELDEALFIKFYLPLGRYRAAIHLDPRKISLKIEDLKAEIKDMDRRHFSYQYKYQSLLWAKTTLEAVEQIISAETIDGTTEGLRIIFLPIKYC